MLRGLLAVGVFGVFFGGLMAYYGVKEKNIAAASTSSPETITLKNLVARGTDGNANIVLTDFVPCENFVVEEKRGSWKGAWVPVVPREQAVDGKGGSPKAFKAVIFCNKARNEGDLYARLGQARLAGLVTNKIMSLGSEQKRILQESYPQTDFSTCLIIHEGREPASETKSALMIYGGIAGVLIGLGLLGAALFLWRKRSAEEPRGTRRRKKNAARSDEDEEDRPRKRRAADEDADERPRRKRRSVEEDEDDRPRKRASVARDGDEDSRPRRRRARGDDEDPPRRRSRRDDD